MTPSFCNCKIIKQNNLPCSPPKNGSVPSSCMTIDQCRKFCSKRGGMISYNPCATRNLIKKTCDSIVDARARFCFDVANEKNTRCLNSENSTCEEYWKNSTIYGYLCNKYIITNTNCIRWVCYMIKSGELCTSVETYQCVNSSCQCRMVICFT